MWNILYASLPRLCLRDGTIGATGGTADVAALARNYRASQVTANSVSQYYQNQLSTSGAPDDIRQETVRDLANLSHNASLQPAQVTAVRDILARAQANQPLTADDLNAMQGIVNGLGQQLAARSAPGMPADLQATVGATPNAERAAGTYQDLRALQAADTHRPPRLTDGTIRTLTEAVAIPRGAGDRGRDGVMGRESAVASARALLTMSDDEFQRTNGLLQGATAATTPPNPRADGRLEQSLLLQTIGSQYRPPANDADRARNTQMFQQVGNFASAMHGMDRETLLQRTTLVSGNSQQSMIQRYENSCGPTTIEMLRGGRDPMYAFGITGQGQLGSLATAGPGNAPLQAASDQQRMLETEGHGVATSRQATQDYQAINNTIAQRTLQLANIPENEALTPLISQRRQALAAANPVDHQALNNVGLLNRYRNSSNFTPTAEQMAGIRSAAAGVGPPPVDIATLDRIRSQRQANDATVSDMQAVRTYMTNPSVTPTADQQAQIQRGLAQINATDTSFNQEQGIYTSRAPQHSNFTMDQLTSIRGQVASHGLASFNQGGSGMALGDALNVANVGRNYSTELVLNPPTASGQVTDQFMNRAATALENGTAVPLRIGYTANNNFNGGGHFMLMSDVRGNSPERQYMVSDPYSGTSQWVQEADLRNGSFANSPQYGFNLGNARTTHMYFPQ